jgi:hypothetical protein
MFVVLFAERTFGGLPIRLHYRQQHTFARPSVRLPPKGQCLALIL